MLYHALKGQKKEVREQSPYRITKIVLNMFLNIFSGYIHDR